MGTWEHRAITASVPALVPSVFPVCSQCVGTRNRGENGVMKGFIERKQSVFPMFSLFFLYIALRAFFSLSLSLSLCIVFFFSPLVKFYFFVGTVGTAGTWRSDATAVGTFFGILGTCSQKTWEQNIGKDRWNMGTSRSDAIYKMFPLLF